MKNFLLLIALIGFCSIESSADVTMLGNAVITPIGTTGNSVVTCPSSEQICWKLDRSTSVFNVYIGGDIVLSGEWIYGSDGSGSPIDPANLLDIEYSEPDWEITISE